MAAANQSGGRSQHGPDGRAVKRHANEHLALLLVQITRDCEAQIAANTYYFGSECARRRAERAANERPAQHQWFISGVLG